MNLFQNFLNAEDGAVTVDWVVLTAAVIGLGVLALTAVRGGVIVLSNKISTSLSARDPDNP